ncbi:MAG TPA: radical SAM protein [Candidatus Wunengus sp. YC64]|uniref:radical SAM protein n=1 Tax=Candidatus Wunengus sp. YC64 TaxID=3367700 RepID=UPI0040284D03
MDKYRIDSHKLLYHVSRVNDWLKGENIYPIYAEISPSGTCNHRCTYCALDFMEYQPRFLDKEMLKERLSEMASLGLKSIMYAGEGEPLLHKDIGEIINHTKKVGIDVAITTNGVLLKKDLLENIIGNVTWIKVSINGATRETYAKTHRISPDNFDKVIKNVSYAVKIRREKGYKCTLGVQLILLPENFQETAFLAQQAKEIGLDYLVIKPYSQHPLSKTTRYKNIKYSDYLHLSDKLNDFNDDKFSVIFRANTMKKWDDSRRNYKHCLALPFWSYIDAGGTVCGCSAYLNNERFSYGNIYETTFKEIWESEKRRKSVQWTEEKLDTSQCRINCRMDEINRYLWDLKHPPEHVNFI